MPIRTWETFGDRRHRPLRTNVASTSTKSVDVRSAIGTSPLAMLADTFLTVVAAQATEGRRRNDPTSTIRFTVAEIDRLLDSPAPPHPPAWDESSTP